MNKILIAEDEPAIANLIKTALDGPDYRCTWAADGISASDLLEREPFDLVLLDIMLPGADGYEVLDYCRSLEAPVIFLTAKGTVEDRVKGLRLGAEDYITKPFELMELLARVETVLRRCGKTGRVLSLPPDIEIDTAAHTVRRCGVPVALTGIAFTKRCGGTNTWGTAAPWICTYSGCEKSWDWKTGWWRYTRWATAWRWVLFLERKSTQKEL